MDCVLPDWTSKESIGRKMAWLTARIGLEKLYWIQYTTCYYTGFKIGNFACTSPAAFVLSLSGFKIVPDRKQWQKIYFRGCLLKNHAHTILY